MFRPVTALTLATAFFGQVFLPCSGAFILQQQTLRSDKKGTPKTHSNANIKKVAVTGATGQTGRLVVEELLSRNFEVVALVRDVGLAKQIFSKPSHTEESKLTVAKCNLKSKNDIGKGKIHKE